MTDWRLPENRREAFLRMYTIHLQYQIHPGCVYFLLPALAQEYTNGSVEELNWIIWLNGNTQNPVTTELLLRASDGSPAKWEKAVQLFNEHFKDLQWDTDRRYQKGRFEVATRQWIENGGPSDSWENYKTWDEAWKHSLSQPYMGRLSAWSMAEYARILYGASVPTPETLLLNDHAGSRSHRDGITLLAGAPLAAAYWGWKEWELLSPFSIEGLEQMGQGLLLETRDRVSAHGDDVNRYTLESALCTWKSWHKPNRRYTGVYADMHWDRILWAEQRWGYLRVQRVARLKALPEPLLKEHGPRADVMGLDPKTQNQYLETGIPAVLGDFYKDMR